MDDPDLILAEITGVLGGENNKFFLSAKDGSVKVECRCQGCGWWETCGEIELWEFCLDAREHWEEKHGSRSG